MGKVSRIIKAVATAASIFGLAFLDGLTALPRYIIMGIGIICFSWLLYDEYKSNRVNERVCTNQDQVNKTMEDIIKSQGKICIVSRDLSWVDENIKQSLVNKKENVLIFAQAKNDTTEQLKAEGIKVKFYGEKYEPKTRFTAIRYNGANPQVAIAHIENTIRSRNSKRRFRHVIYETSSTGPVQDRWISSLAVDLITLCNLVSKDE